MYEFLDKVAFCKEATVCNWTNADLLCNKLWQFDNFSFIFLSHNHYLLAELSTKTADAAMQ